MNGGLQRFARRLWEGRLGVAGRVLSIALIPASALWRAVTAARDRRLARRGPEAVEGLVVVSVGNLAVGGTGKTPLASWVVRRLVDRGRRTAVLLSGYGSDEVALHRIWAPNAVVVADRDRAAAARRARDEGAEVAVLDDGFQHRRLARDLDLVLLAVEDPFPGPVLPRGPYREGIAALRRAHGIVLTRRGATGLDAVRALERALRASVVAPHVPIAGVHLAAGALRPMTSAGSPGRAGLPEAPLVLTAVARPDAVLADVVGLCGRTTGLVAFADHHDFTEADARAARARAGDRAIVVTEKDAVKLERHAAVLGEVWVLEQEVCFDWGEEELARLLERLP